MELLRKIKDYIIFKTSKSKYNKIMLNRAIEQAKTKWIQSGKRHFVLFIDGNYLVVNKDIMKLVNKKRKKKYKNIELMKMAVYFTPQSTYHNSDEIKLNEKPKYRMSSLFRKKKKVITHG